MLESLSKVLVRIEEIRSRFMRYHYNNNFEIKKIKFEEVLNEKINISKSNYTTKEDFIKLIEHYSNKYGVDASLVKAIVKAESNFNPFAVSHKGACGLMQLMPQTAKELGVNDIFSPEENIEGGIKYLKYLLNRFNNNLKLALAAYNAGPSIVEKVGGIPNIEETKNYVKAVMNFYLNEKYD